MPVVTMATKTTNIVLCWWSGVGIPSIHKNNNKKSVSTRTSTFVTCDHPLRCFLSYFPSTYYSKTFLSRNKAHIYK